MTRFALVMILLTPSLACGQITATIPSGAPPADEIRTVRLVVRPAAPPRAALRYQLLPPVTDRRPGNAALGYYKALLQSSSAKKVDKVSDWLELPIEKLPRAEVRDALATMSPVLEETDRAARRNRCDWQLPLAESYNAFTLPLPEVSPMRELARFVALQAKLQIAEGKLDDAVHTLQTGFAMGRHMSEGQTIIHALVGMAICRMMSDRVEELLQLPDAPNLYWSLTMLPEPLVDLRPGLETEMNCIYLGVPVLRNLDRSRNDAAYWQSVLEQLDETIKTDWAGGRSPQASWRPALTLMAVKGYPMARRMLMEQGRSAAEVEAMPVPKVVILAALQQYNEMRDMEFKWFFVPYWEAAPGMAQAERYLQTEGRSRELVPLASMLLPALSAARYAAARNDRNIAELRTIEALRLYGAVHDGRFPEKLTDIKEVPLPIDAVTGQPFTYLKSGDTAVLESLAPAGRPKSQGVRMEIRFK